MTEEIILQGEFRIYPKTKLYDVRLTTTDIRYRETDDRSGGEVQRRSWQQDCVLLLCDMTGCRLENMQRSANNNAAYFTVYCYPKTSKQDKFSTALCRTKQHVTLVYNKHDNYSDNVEDLKPWSQEIERLIQSCYKLQGRRLCKGNKILFLVNPYSGRKKALGMFKETAEPMIKEAGLDYEIIITERANHAMEYAQQLDLEEWTGVVIVSGDGLIYEVINGLMNRVDWREAIKLPIGALPCGSGNALCAAINFKASEPYMESFLLHSTFVLLKQTVQPLDLLSVDIADGSRLYGFLGIGWAIVSDVDIESEKLRYLGALRFTVTGIAKILKMKRYKARLSFQPVEPYKGTIRATRKLSINAEKRAEHTPLSGSFRRTQSMFDYTTTHITHLALGNDVRRDASTDLHDSGSNDTCRNTLPTLDEPVPSNWVTIEDEFVYFSATLISHLATDTVVNPSAELDDGLLTLSLLRGGTTRAQLLQMFSASGEVDNNKRDYSILEQIKVKAFRLTPMTSDGILTVDGERVAYGPIQAHVLPSCANIMGKVY